MANRARRPAACRNRMKMRPTLARKSSIAVAAIDPVMLAAELGQHLIADADAGLIAGRAQPAIGIADAEGRDPAGARGAEGAVIAHRLPLVELARLKDFCFKFNCLSHGVASPWTGVATV